MTKSILNQSDYTRLFIEKANKDPAKFHDFHKEWWWNFKDQKNLRLSKNGFKTIENCKIPYYIIELPESLKNRTLIQLSRRLACPYYIKKLDLIYLLGEQETVLLKLHADNIQQYLDNLEL